MCENHTRGESITPSLIRVLENKKSWIVNSVSDKSQEYYVAKVGEMCKSSCLKCPVCRICVHTFTCTCTDSIIKMNICKHIHACTLEFYKAVNDICNDNINNNNDKTNVNNKKNDNKMHLENKIRE